MTQREQAEQKLERFESLEYMSQMRVETSEKINRNRTTTEEDEEQAALEEERKLRIKRLKAKRKAAKKYWFSLINIG